MWEEQVGVGGGGVGMLDLTMSGEGYVSPRFYSIQITPNLKKKKK